MVLKYQRHPWEPRLNSDFLFFFPLQNFSSFALPFSFLFYLSFFSIVLFKKIRNSTKLSDIQRCRGQRQGYIKLVTHGLKAQLIAKVGQGWGVGM